MQLYRLLLLKFAENADYGIEKIDSNRKNILILSQPISLNLIPQ